MALLSARASGLWPAEAKAHGLALSLAVLLVPVPVLSSETRWTSRKSNSKNRLPKDSNDLQAIRLVLGNAILFQTGKSDLSATAQAALSRVATNLAQYPQTDITVMGYTDNTGGYDLNMRLSQERADAVRNYLIGRGIPAARLTAKGNGWSNPVASNDTKEGRAQNRRVEMYITANEQMINEAATATQQ